MSDKKKKLDQLDELKSDLGEELTTSQGVKISDNQNSLKAGNRGPTLMEDFIFREKMTHFDHERIPERIVHARGSAAHGFFECTEDLSDLTIAKFLRKGVTTPVFVRFSTVVGFRGSADTVRDARGFATKFYTEDGNYDLVGNNMPVFFIQDAIKFPDLVHSIKPEPQNEIPQASAAHDNFWDFISLMPESMHMIMWVLSDRALPRSYAEMEGFGVHTFRLINSEGKSKFVKFHWKPVMGMASLTWDETQKIAGKNPDYNRQQLWEAIENGHYPEYELGLQIVNEEDEFKFNFDLLDPTKLIPEEIVPVKIVGKMTLNRNPDNFFAETEQVAFHPGHIVPGIDFTNDPLLQGRLFSYLDTQLIRLGGPNFSEIPINRPVCPVHNNMRDGFMRQTINKGRINYEPNSLGGGCPMQSPDNLKAFVSYAEKMEGNKIRVRSESFSDHYSQATMFWNSQTDIEKQHIVEGFHFELGKVENMEIRKRMIAHLNKISFDLAVQTAKGIGVEPPDNDEGTGVTISSPALSINLKGINGIKTRKVMILVSEGANESEINELKSELKKEGASAMLISKYLGKLNGNDEMMIDINFEAAASVLFDAIYIPDGNHIDTLKGQGKVKSIVIEAFKHLKPIGATGRGIELLRECNLPEIKFSGEGSDVVNSEKGVITVSGNNKNEEFYKAFIDAMKQHRFWNRKIDMVPA